MPVDIALQAIGNPIYGNHPPAPMLPALQGQAALAEDTNSAAINVPAVGAVLVLVATAKLRLDIRLQADAGSLNPGASAVVLGANERLTYFLTRGNYVLKTSVYA